MTFDPLPVSCAGRYFAGALANWAINYSTRRRPPDCWYVVWVNNPSSPPWRREFVSTDKMIVNRFRHPLGRCFTYDEMYLVVNKLNQDDLVALASSTNPGGMTNLVRNVSRQILALR